MKKPRNPKKRKQKFIRTPEFKPKPKYDWSVRYGDLEQYRMFCAKAHQATHGKCCVCLTAKSEVIHHSRYLGKDDEPGVNAFPCCLRCHKTKCHSIGNWKWDDKDPVWGNHNSVGFEKRLQGGFKMLSEGRTLKITPVV